MSQEKVNKVLDVRKHTIEVPETIEYEEEPIQVPNATPAPTVFSN